MEYPVINGKSLSQVDKALFRRRKEAIKKSIIFDNKQNELHLNSKDIELLSWNITTYLIGI